MATILSYPAASYASGPLVDFNSLEERKRLSGSALIGFFKMMEIWKVRDEDAKLLLGGVSNGQYYAMKRSPRSKVLSTDQMWRTSSLFGVFKAINTLHGQEFADRWAQLPNKGPLFNGKTPLQYMVEGGPSAIEDVRRLLEGQIQGT
jgi:hypothetical protein